jgi:hypothetical protein
VIGIVGRAVRRDVLDGDGGCADETVLVRRRSSGGVFRRRHEHDGVVIDHRPVEIESRPAAVLSPKLPDGLWHSGLPEQFRCNLHLRAASSTSLVVRSIGEFHLTR